MCVASNAKQAIRLRADTAPDAILMDMVMPGVDGVLPDIPPLACKIVIALAEQTRELQARIAMLEGEIKAWFRGNEVAKRLETIPGIGTTRRMSRV